MLLSGFISLQIDSEATLASTKHTRRIKRQTSEPQFETVQLKFTSMKVAPATGGIFIPPNSIDFGYEIIHNSYMWYDDFFVTNPSELTYKQPTIKISHLIFLCRAVFANFGDRLLDSPVVLSVLVGLFVIYVLLLVWARRADRTDLVKVKLYFKICLIRRSSELLIELNLLKSQFKI